jgi:hypothetical protein
MVSGFLLHGPRGTAPRNTAPRHRPAFAGRWLRPADARAAATASPDGPRPDTEARGGELPATLRRQFRRFLSVIDPPGPHGRATEVDSLAGAARRFLAHPRPPVLVGAVATLAAARAARGDFRRADGAVALGAIAAQPFVEWGVHRYLLHAPPTGRYGRLAYRALGSGHAQHHQDPLNLNSMFMRGQDVLGGTAIALAAGAVGSPQLATGMFCVGAAALAYDWTHFLIHTAYRPRSGPYRRIWRSHRLHHYRNERYWLGVTSPLADIVLRTSPARDAVPVSPAAARPEIQQPRGAPAVALGAGGRP